MRSFTLPVIVVAMLWSVACESVNTAERAEPIAVSDPVALKKVEPDFSLRQQVQIVSANQGVANDLLRVQVVVRNNWALRKGFNYRFEWYDANGMQVETSRTAAWKTARLQPKESITLTGIAPSPSVVDFRLKLVENP